MAVEASAISSAGVPTTPRSPLRDSVELAVGYLLILIVIWSPRAWQRPFYIAALLWITAATLLSLKFTDGARAMGLRLSGIRRSLWIIPAALFTAAIAILIASRLHTLNQPDTPAGFIKRYWGYAIWACLQQFLLQDFFLLRLLHLTRTTTAAVLAATAMFALAHLPNPILTPITILWGSIACLLFLRYRSLYPLAIAHAVLGITVALTVPGPIDHNMRVGLGYLTYRHHHPHPHLSQNDQIVSTTACVTAEAPTRLSFRHALP